MLLPTECTVVTLLGAIFKDHQMAQFMIVNKRFSLRDINQDNFSAYEIRMTTSDLESVSRTTM